MKQFFGKKSRSALALVIGVSFALHVVAILIFGTIKFVTDVLREEKTFIAAPVAPPPQQEPEYTVNIQPINESTPPPRLPAIVVNNPSELDIPVLDIDVNVDSSSVYGRGGGGFGGSGLQGIREMTITADLFGMEITTESLGVVLDISGSAHAHLDKAIKEIDKNFPTAHMVLVVGCGMSETDGVPAGGGKVPGKPRIVTYNDRDKEEKYNSLGRSVPAQLEDFFKKIGEKRSKEVQRYFKRRENLYVLYGGDIHAANYAFEHVIDLGVDTIYWFADFADRVDQPVVEDLTKLLRRKGIKVIAHNFLGKPVRANVAEMAKTTGGTTIELVPGKEKK